MPGTLNIVPHGVWLSLNGWAYNGTAKFYESSHMQSLIQSLTIFKYACDLGKGKTRPKMTPRLFGTGTTKIKVPR